MSKETVAAKLEAPPSFEPQSLPVFAVTPLGGGQAASHSEPVAQGIDLSGKPKIIFAAGRGKTGKTTLLRWMAERGRAEQKEFLLADIDPTNASFAAYFPEAAQPKTIDPLGVRQWLQGFLQYAFEKKASAMIDLGGGDTALRSLAAEMPTLVETIESAGLAVAVFYLVGHQIEDLTPIATLTDLKFVPKARAIVLNEGTAPLGIPRTQAFARVLSHPVFVEQIKTGAIHLWMPRLFAADAVEARRASFVAAREGKTNPPLGIFDRSRVHHWLTAMEEQFAGVASWRP